MKTPNELRNLLLVSKCFLVRITGSCHQGIGAILFYAIMLRFILELLTVDLEL